MSRASISPFVSKLSLKDSGAVVLIGVARRRVGRDNSSYSAPTPSSPSRGHR